MQGSGHLHTAILDKFVEMGFADRVGSRLIQSMPLVTNKMPDILPDLQKMDKTARSSSINTPSDTEQNQVDIGEAKESNGGRYYNRQSERYL